MKRLFVEPEMEVTEFTVADIVTISGDYDEGQGGLPVIP